MKNVHRTVLIASALFSTLALIPSPALATSIPITVDVAIGAGGHGGGATLYDADLADDRSSTTLGGGAQVWVGFQIMKALTIGGLVDYSISSHALEQSNTNVDVSAFTSGGFVRVTPGDSAAFKVWFGAGFGTLLATAPGTNNAIPTHCIQLGLAAHYRVPIGGDVFGIEVGPYYTYNAFTIDRDHRDSHALIGESITHYHSYGLALDLVFEIGL